MPHYGNHLSDGLTQSQISWGGFWFGCLFILRCNYPQCCHMLRCYFELNQCPKGDGYAALPQVKPDPIAQCLKECRPTLEDPATLRAMHRLGELICEWFAGSRFLLQSLSGLVSFGLCSEARGQGLSEKVDPTPLLRAAPQGGRGQLTETEQERHVPFCPFGILPKGQN